MEILRYNVFCFVFYTLAGYDISHCQESAAISNFWSLKMRTYFSRMDFDRDDTITRKDFKDMAGAFIKFRDLKNEQASDMIDTLCEVWDKYLEPFSGGEPLNQDRFIEIMSKLMHDPKLKDMLQGPLPLFFHADDANDNQLISRDELIQYFEILKLDSALVDNTFAAIDANSDGYSSSEEFLTAGNEFLTEEHDESKSSKLFFGPLLTTTSS